MTIHRYHINVFWSEEDSCWIADVPDLRPCSAHGSTPEEALAEVEVAIELWLDWAREKGSPVPEPAYRPSPPASREAA
jgi:predicted RNase H-like HicB family nuclease